MSTTAETLGIDLSVDAASGINQYLSFILADEEYGVEILRVREIRIWEKPTRIPGTPRYVLGVINLRGLIVPIVDLRRRFRMPPVQYDANTVVVILQARSAEHERTIGIVVDHVSDVYKVNESEIRPAPDLGINIDTAYIRGLVTIKKGADVEKEPGEGKQQGDVMLIILDIDRLLDVNTLMVDDTSLDDEEQVVGKRQPEKKTAASDSASE
jgi:purine-binding chemotaxis protein CheW